MMYRLTIDDGAGVNIVREHEDQEVLTAWADDWMACEDTSLVRECSVRIERMECVCRPGVRCRLHVLP